MLYIVNTLLRIYKRQQNIMTSKELYIYFNIPISTIINLVIRYVI
jgi:hypothetical protein